jgi:tryptophan-rich sensory protein
MHNQERNSSGKWRWYHGLLFFGVIQAFEFGLGKLAQVALGQNKPKVGASVVGNSANDEFYNSLKQPTFAPPDWSFAPVWTLNNALCIWGLLQVLNMPKERRGRNLFLTLQGVVWFCFTAFNGAYFGMRSPVNGAILTDIGLGATVASVYVALAQLKDGRTALSQSTILPWLLLAGPTATTVAAWNRDDFYNAGPFVEADPQWVKSPQVGEN